MKRFFLLVIFLSVVPLLYSQDLDRLRERSTSLWSARVQHDRAKALQYVLPSTRSGFEMYEFVQEAKVAGFEFLENSSRVSVTVKAKLGLPPPFNNLEKSMAEVWEWTNGNWFLRATASNQNPFTNLLEAPGTTAGVPSPKFELVEHQLDLGQHKQGDRVAGTVHFTANRSEIGVFRARGITGISINQPDWNSNNKGGTIHFVLDTALLSANAQLTATFDVVGLPVGLTYPTTEDTLRLSIGISGQVRVRQVPDVIDPRQAGRADIEIQNVSDKPFGITGVVSTSEAFKTDGDVPPIIQPGQIIKLQISYLANSQPVSGELLFTFSAGVLPGDSLVFPLSVLAPEPAPPSDLPAGLTREQLEEIIRQHQPH